VARLEKLSIVKRRWVKYEDDVQELKLKFEALTQSKVADKDVIKGIKKMIKEER